MNFKEHLKSTFSSFFVIVTLVNVATFVLGSIFHPGAKFGYEAFLSPILYGAISIVPMLAMYSKKERTFKQEVIRQVILLLVLEAVLVIFGLGVENISDNIFITISYIACIAVVFVLVHVIEWLLGLRTAKQINVKLKEFQNRHSGRE